jgi:hypothetical protein
MKRVKKNIFLYCVDMKCDAFNAFLTNLYTAYLAYRQHSLLEFVLTRISSCFDHRGIIPLRFDQIVVFVKSQNHINFCYYLALVVRQFVIQVSPFNLHRNNLVEISTVSTYSILSFCINCHFCFLI